MPWTETVTGVQQHVISGFDIDKVSARTMGLGEIAPYVLVAEHMYTPHFVIANTDWYEGLNKEDRALFDEMFKVLIDKSIEFSREDDRNAAADLTAKGHTLTPLDPAEKAAWAKSVMDVYKQFSQIPAEFVEEIHAELKKMGKI